MLNGCWQNWHCGVFACHSERRTPTPTVLPVRDMGGGSSLVDQSVPPEVHELTDAQVVSRVMAPPGAMLGEPGGEPCLYKLRPDSVRVLLRRGKKRASPLTAECLSCGTTGVLASESTAFEDPARLR